MAGATDLVQVISSVGFPIVMCLILMWYTKDIMEKHKDESDKFTEALHQNTLVLQELCDKLEAIEGK
jgi:hypothetical protein